MQCGGGFADDYCGAALAFPDDVVARAMACLAQPCGEALAACLRNTLGKPAGCP